MRTRTLLPAALLCSLAFATTTHAQAVEPATGAQVTMADSTNSQSAREPSAAIVERRKARTIAFANRSTTRAQIPKPGSPENFSTTGQLEEPDMKLFAAIMLLAKTTRWILAMALALACVVLFLPSSSTALAQTPQAGSQPQEPEAGVEDDPTRAVFFSVREEYRNLIDGAWNNRIVLRRDAVVLKGKHGGGLTGYLLRTDVPITTTHRGSETHTGLGDIYGQALYIPYLSRKFAFVTGTGIVLPTATHKTLGLGKWQVAPLAVPVWFLAKKKGYFQVKFQDFISVAGVGDRPDVHMLLITPALNYVPARRWLVNADVESRTNWKNGNRTDFRVGFGAGRVMTRRFFLGVKCEVPIGATRPGDWTLKVINVFYR